MEQDDSLFRHRTVQYKFLDTDNKNKRKQKTVNEETRPSFPSPSAPTTKASCSTERLALSAFLAQAQITSPENKPQNNEVGDLPALTAPRPRPGVALDGGGMGK